MNPVLKYLYGNNLDDILHLYSRPHKGYRSETSIVLLVDPHWRGATSSYTARTHQHSQSWEGRGYFTWLLYDTTTLIIPTMIAVAALLLIGRDATRDLRMGRRNAGAVVDVARRPLPLGQDAVGQGLAPLELRHVEEEDEEGNHTAWCVNCWGRGWPLELSFPTAGMWPWHHRISGRAKTPWSHLWGSPSSPWALMGGGKHKSQIQQLANGVDERAASVQIHSDIPILDESLKSASGSM